MARGAPSMLLALSCLLLLKLALSQPRPMCAPQFVLANRACAVMAVGGDLPINASLALAGDDRHEHRSQHGHGQGHGHGHGHGHSQHHNHNHHHDNNNDHDNEETRATRDCCRWLKEVDPTCVCEALIRLPPFLTKPKHTYSISIGDACKFEYNCKRV